MRKFKIVVDNEEYEVEVEEMEGGERKITKTEPVKAKTTTQPKTNSAPTQPKQESQSAGGSGDITAPLPGVVTEVLVSEGDTVNSEDVVLILEAMKMENKIQANVSGTVSSIEVKEGESVNEGDAMVVIN
ncbi:biotin/lipoyl-containing protein [Selenihalanaerobacter shriftii]|uniref:Biotin-requiring enzyme n=1 Tax=Selenihalanaerobacter shriftii TaxID=142842 RepID=A0A1T4JTZ6_9FIRM|nr:biotin/lipoyl-containing protein [Selenihalanaerobacter shriftii]SJZ33537.1 Biotin-requiring enzyme [Selenihalanaerobacter shriftii]